MVMVGSVMACVDFVESVGVSDGFMMDRPSYCPPASSFGWLSPRISFSKDFVQTAEIQSNHSDPEEKQEQEQEPEPGMQDNGNDFEFCLSLPDDPLSMLPADELFYQGKLMPLQCCPSRSGSGPLTDQSFSSNDGEATIPTTTSSSATTATKPTTIQMICSSVDPLSVSPKAPRCSSRWKELLGLRKLQTHKQDILSLHSSVQPTKASLPTKAHLTSKSLKHLFRGSDSKPHSPSSLDLSSQPLLAHLPSRDSDADSGSARLSVSSSSCAADLDDLPRYSLDSEKGNPNPIRAPLRVNVRKPRFHDGTSDGRGGRLGRSPYRNIDAKLPPRGSSVDSPRMNSSGKIVFHGLERSCSSPSSFSTNMRCKDHHYRNCRQKENWRAMERSYSANVRVTPVLNVPVRSLRVSKGGGGGGGGGASTKGNMFGFTQLFSPQKKEINKPNRIPSHTSGGISSSNPHRREG